MFVKIITFESYFLPPDVQTRRSLGFATPGRPAVSSYAVITGGE